MRYKKTLIIITALLIIISVLFVHYNILSKDEFELISDIISSIGTILTIYLAILLYDHFGIDRELKLKSFDSVSQLIVKFQKIGFTIESHYSKVGRSFFFLRFNDKDFFSESEYLRSNLYFHSSAIEALHDLYSIKDDVLLPIEVAKALNELNISAFSKIDPSDDSSDYCIISCPSYKDTLSLEKGVYAIYSSNRITASDFINHYKQLKCSIVDWVKNNTSESQQLNLQI